MAFRNFRRRRFGLGGIGARANSAHGARAGAGNGVRGVRALIFGLIVASLICDRCVAKQLVNIRRAKDANIHFIHIGKCGGTMIKQWLTKNGIRHHEVHLNLPKEEIRVPDTYIVWIRDPIARFRSAYDYQRAIITTDVSHWARTNRTACWLGPKCLAPSKILRKFKTGYAYNEEFDTLNLLFQNANHLAESISLDNELGENARKLMNSPYEHVSKGIGFYLDGGEFVRRHHDRMVVGALERGPDDLKKLAAYLKISNPKEKVKNSRKNHKSTSTTPLSVLALKNLRAFYEPDYSAIREMEKYGLVPQGLYTMDGLS